MSSPSAEKTAPPEDAPPAKPGKRKLLLLAVPLLLGGVGAGLWFGGILPKLLGLGPATDKPKPGEGNPGETKPEAEAKARIPVFVDVPDLVANLNGGQKRNGFIKLKARLELAKAEDQPVVVAAMPRLQDLFTTYLREMRPEELRGAAGTYRLREELVARANIATSPARVTDVLFTEMLIQ